MVGLLVGLLLLLLLMKMFSLSVLLLSHHRCYFYCSWCWLVFLIFFERQQLFIKQLQKQSFYHRYAQLVLVTLREEKLPYDQFWLNKDKQQQQQQQHDNSNTVPIATTATNNISNNTNSNNISNQQQCQIDRVIMDNN